MTTPDARADGGARNDAIKLVGEALKAGRIVQADHDMRVGQLRHAQTMQDIDLLVRDLRAVPAGATASAPSTPTVVTTQESWPAVNYGPAPDDAAELLGKVQKGGKAIGAIITVVVLVAIVVPVVAAVIAFFAARDSFPTFDGAAPTDETTYLPGQEPGENGVNVLTVDGFEALVDAVREEKGDTFTFSTVIYPRYAVVDIPTGVNERYEGWYWDGRTLEKNTTRGSTGDDQLDLSLIDPEQLIRMVTYVRDNTDSPDSWYVVISDYENTETQITAYASNDFGETTYVTEQLDGTVLYDSSTAP